MAYSHITLNTIRLCLSLYYEVDVYILVASTEGEHGDTVSRLVAPCAPRGSILHFDHFDHFEGLLGNERCRLQFLPVLFTFSHFGRFFHFVKKLFS